MEHSKLLVGEYLAAIDPKLHTRSVDQPTDIVDDLLDSLVQIGLGILVFHVADWQV